MVAPEIHGLLWRMRKTPHQGWTFHDLERLYVGFGFSYRDKEETRVYTHVGHPKLIVTVTRGRVPVGYIDTAIRVIDIM